MKKENQLVAYLRIVDFSDNKAHIGRIVAKVKGQGYGTKLLLETIDYCKLTKNIHKIVLNAQINALNFYKKLNFEISSEEYLIDNIPHVDMELIIDK